MKHLTLQLQCRYHMVLYTFHQRVWGMHSSLQFMVLYNLYRSLNDRVFLYHIYTALPISSFCYSDGLVGDRHATMWVTSS